MTKRTFAAVAFSLAIFQPALALDESEQLEKLARQYRIQVYNTFRTNRAEYNQRQEIGRLAEWIHGHSEDDQDLRNEIREWFVIGKQSSAESQTLPALPGQDKYESVAAYAKSVEFEYDPTGRVRHGSWAPSYASNQLRWPSRSVKTNSHTTNLTKNSIPLGSSNTDSTSSPVHLLSRVARAVVRGTSSMKDLPATGPDGGAGATPNTKPAVAEDEQFPEVDVEIAPAPNLTANLADRVAEQRESLVRIEQALADASDPDASQLESWVDQMDSWLRRQEEIDAQSGAESAPAGVDVTTATDLMPLVQTLKHQVDKALAQSAQGSTNENGEAKRLQQLAVRLAEILTGE